MNLNSVELFNQLTAQTWQHLNNQLSAHKGTLQNSTATHGVDAAKLMQMQCEAFSKQTQLFTALAQSLQNNIKMPDLVAQKSDKRFDDPAWQQQPLFNFLKQNYLINAQLIEQQLVSLTFDTEAEAAHWKFYTRQLVNALAPTNFPWTNPDVLRELLQDQGENLQRGFNNLLMDLQKSPLETLKISQVDLSQFKLGENIACTPGKVVFRNQLFELLQYAPCTDTVFTTPLLFVPPFINKYYILDLNEKKSLVRWLTQQGFTVFMMSWVNPSEADRHMAFRHYMHDGVITAMERVSQLTQSKKIHAAGYCVGGTLLACSQAWLKAQKREPLASLTLLTTLLDFSNAGDLGHYLYPPLLEKLEPLIKARGLLDGRVMATSFNFLRENDLYWPNYINHYLKGQKPPAFDLLYWNSDSTNLTEQIFHTYVKNFYHENPLLAKAPFLVDGIALELSNIDTPSYCVGAEKDHIVLWQAALTSAKLLAGPIRFVLAGSGHIAGVVNPPSQAKYGYRAGPLSTGAKGAETLDWQSMAETPGSWWQDWHHWLMEQAPERGLAPQPGKVVPLGDAPGNYVRRLL